MKKVVLTLLAAASFMAANAQVVVKTDAGDLSLRLIGRTNFDIASQVGAEDDRTNDNGVQMSDTRLGVVASFDKNWTAKAEICYANSKVSFRDLYIGYSFNPSNYIQIGNFFAPYGAKVLGLQYKFIDDASADLAFTPSRKIGGAYFHTTDHFNFNAGIFSDGNVDAPALKQGYSFAAKAIWRPVIDEQKVLHIGVAPFLTHSPNTVTYTGKMSSPVINHTFITTGAIDAISYQRYEAELIYIYRRFYLEGHYLASTVNLEGPDNYMAQGFYVQSSYLLKGDQQRYNKKTGLATAPAPKSLEILARVSHLNLEDDDAAPLSATQKLGKQTDFTLGLNYFINNNLNAKVNYSYGVGQVKGADDDQYHMLMGRLQFSF